MPSLFQLFFDLPGGQPIGDVSTIKRHDLGTRVRARDYTYGEGEFIYQFVPGTTPVSRGAFVAYAVTGNTQTQPLADGMTPGAPLAIAMADHSAPSTSGTFGWFQVRGAGQAKVDGDIPVNSASVYGAAAGNGLVTATTRAGYRIAGARFLGGGSGSLADIQIADPSPRVDL